MSDAQPAVLVAAPFPPPVHGFSVIMSAMAEAIAEQAPVVRVDLAAQRGSRLATHLAQLARCFAGCAAIVKHAFAGGRISALGVNGGIGQLYTIMLACAARLAGQQITLHHHSYLYINHRSKLMALLLTVAGKDAIHVFLSEEMAEAFQQRYRRAIRSDVLSNAMFVTPSVSPRAQNARLVAGLLSNLSYEKGLHDFLELAGQARSAGLLIDFVLAGPAALEADRARIEAAVAAGTITWLGPLYGQDKERFYADIDLLVFPTRYRFEAQPTIIYEAFSAGVPVLSIARGTIGAQVEGSLPAIPVEQDFVAAALPVLKTLADMTDAERARLSDQVRGLHRQSTEAGRQAVSRLFHQG